MHPHEQEVLDGIEECLELCERLAEKPEFIVRVDMNGVQNMKNMIDAVDGLCEAWDTTPEFRAKARALITKFEAHYERFKKGTA